MKRRRMQSKLNDRPPQIRNGQGAMPPFSGALSAEEIEAVAHYVVEQIVPKA